MNYYLGIDIGTTSTKAIAFSTEGETMAKESIGYAMHHPQPGWSEQNPDEILQAVFTCINKIVASLAGHTLSFISFSAVMHSLLAIDEEGKPLTQCIIWADNRSEEIASRLRHTETGFRFYQATGVPIHSMSPFCKLLWLKEQLPNIFGSAYKFLGIKEYLFYKLFGVFVVDTPVASATGLLNLKTLEWDAEILNYSGITSAQLSGVAAPKQVYSYSSTNPSLHLPEKTPVIIGGSDGALSNLGSGATGSNSLCITIGTSGAVRMLVKNIQTDRHMRTFCYHANDDAFITGGATNNGAVVLQWLKESLLQTAESYEALFRQAQHIAPGSDGLLFLPYLLGERAPIWNAHAKGVFFGLSIQHSKAHLIKAVMEGVIYNLLSIAKTITAERTVTGLYASGGFARSNLWLQILADIFHTTVIVSEEVETSALGAVMMGAEALGLRFNPRQNIHSIFEPVAHQAEVYKKGFKRFERIYEALKEEMKG